MVGTLWASIWGYILGPLLAILSVFLILLILIQRGRGGGLIGALGGPGGQSAFGTKAGDVFTRITVVTTCIWLLLCLATIALLNNRTQFRSTSGGQRQPSRTGELQPRGEPAPPATTSTPTGTSSGSASNTPAGPPPSGTPDKDAAPPATTQPK